MVVEGEGGPFRSIVLAAGASVGWRGWTSSRTAAVAASAIPRTTGCTSASSEAVGPARVGAAGGVAAARERIRGAGRSPACEDGDPLAAVDAWGTRAAAMFRGTSAINPGSEPRPLPAASWSRFGPLPRLPRLIFGALNNPGLRGLTPGEAAVSVSVSAGPSAVPSTEESGDDCAAGPSVLSVGPLALAIPAPPATAAPMPRASANEPTRRTYVAAPAAVGSVECLCRAAICEALCRPMAIPLSPADDETLACVPSCFGRRSLYIWTAAWATIRAPTRRSRAHSATASRSEA